MKKFHKLIIAFVLLLPQITLAESMRLEVIPLQKRSVDDVIQIIRPLVTPGPVTIRCGLSVGPRLPPRVAEGSGLEVG